MVAVVVFVGAGSVLLTLARAVAKRIAGGAAGPRELDGLREEVAQLRGEVDGLHERLRDVDEIQNRLDFTERLLAQAKQRGLLDAPRER